MEIKKKLKSHERLNLTLGLLGILIAIFFGTYGIISAYQESRSEITFEIINEVNVLDVHESLTDLIIYFQGEDVQEKNLNLRIMTIRIENKGNVDILQNHYDINDIWGFQLKNGEIIKLKLIDSNSDYIKLNLNPVIHNNQTIKFSKIIFEKEKYFTMEILVLHKKNESPEIIPTGKIATIDKIVPIKLSDEKEETFIGRLFHGNFFTNFMRFIVFGISGILVLYSFTLLIDKKDDLKMKNKLKRRFEKIVLQHHEKFFEMEKYDIIKKLYINLRYPFITSLIELFRDTDQLLYLINKVQSFNEPTEFKTVQTVIRKEWMSENVNFAIINYLYTNGIIKIENDRIFPEPIKFSEFLKLLFI